jgi:cysteine-S-conjugate beta-lyase
MKFGTKLIHNGNEIDKTTGALSIPIYQVSTFHQGNVEERQEFDYSRSGNPTRSALEKTIAILENGDRGFAFSSGMAATSSVLSIFSAGDHFIVCEDVYGGTFRITSKFFNRFGIETTFVDASDPENIKKSIRKNTKAVFIETPSNPLLKITDIKSVVKIARENSLVSIIDNTFMSCYLQRPLDLGMDIVIHSATKFIGGHSDVLGGLVVTKNKELSNMVYSVQNSFGAVLGPQDSWLVLRGLKTLKVRMDYEQSNAVKLALWLKNHKSVTAVYFPGLENHPGRDIHLSQADGPGAVLSFRLKDRNKLMDFLNNVKIGVVAVSLGGVETIISYPARMSHASMPESERSRLGITDDLLRVSLGLEDIDDIISEFDKALK